MLQITENKQMDYAEFLKVRYRDPIQASAHAWLLSGVVLLLVWLGAVPVIVSCGCNPWS